MQRTSYPRKKLLRAFGLGLLGLLTYAVTPFISSDIGCNLGNFFAFTAAICFGVPGALIASSITTLPLYIATNEISALFEFTRTIILALAISGVLSVRPRIPAYSVVFGTWVMLIMPLALLFERTGALGFAASHTKLLILAMSDVILAMTAGAALYNQRLWCLVTDHPRAPSFSGLISHVLSLLTTTTVFGTLLLVSDQNSATLETLLGSRGVAWVGLFLSAVILAPVAYGERLAKRIIDNLQNFDTAGMLSQMKTRSFSGLSSEYWRRNTATDMSVSSTSNSSSGIGTTTAAGVKALSPDDGICALTRDGTISFANRRFLKVADLKTSDVVGKNIAIVGGDSELIRSLRSLVDRFFTKGPQATEVKVNCLPQSLRFFEIRTKAAEELEGSSLKGGADTVIVSVKDITHRRTIENHLLQAQKLDSLGSLLGGVAHQFNNALTAITGQASVAQMSDNFGMVKESLHSILDSAKDAGRIVRQLLDFAEGRPSLMEDKDLARVIGDRSSLLKKIVGDDYEVSYTRPHTPIGISCDSNLIMQALTNLVLNAKDSYRSNPGTIEISLDTETLDEQVSELFVGARPGTFARLRVKDTGCGMSPEILSRAFDPLFTTKGSKGNAGLGLSIVYAIIRAHDGFLTAESHPEKGTTISLYFPLRELVRETAISSAEVSKSHGTKITSPAVGHNEKVLVVEDEANVRDLVATMLSTLGYDVTTCANGDEALERSAGNQFDVLLVDMIMPRMRGLDLIEKLKDHQHHAKTVLMTGHISIPQSNVAIHSIIHKPFDMDGLAKAVHDALQA